MTYQEIIEKAKEQLGEDGVNQFAYEDFDKELFGTIKKVDRNGGEGKGEDWWVVFYFVDHDVYIKVSGWYQSYDGTSFEDGWDCCSEVRPKEKTITVYE